MENKSMVLDTPSHLMNSVEVLIITSKKVDDFTDTMIEDIQDIIKIEMEGDFLGFKHGILPPRYKEVKDELKSIIQDYILDNIIYVGQDPTLGE
jgi:hypothetical protein